MTTRMWTLGLSLCLLVVAGTARANVTIDLRPAATLERGQYVRLGEIAHVKGEGEDVSRVRGVFLGPGPQVGNELRISRTEIRRHLVDQGLADRIAFAGAQAVIVRAQKKVARTEDATAKPAAAPEPTPEVQLDLTEGELSDLVRTSTAKHVLGMLKRKDASAAVRVLRLQGSAATSTVTLRVARRESGRLPGRAQLRLQAIDHAGRTVGDVKAYIDVDVSAPVVVLRRNLNTGQVLSPGDVLVRREEIDIEKAYLPTTAAAVVGQAAAKPLRAGALLMAGDLMEPIAVRKGRLVRVDTLSGGFRVRSHARALADGRVGDMIEVENITPASRKKYAVTVTGIDRVSVARPGGN